MHRKIEDSKKKVSNPLPKPNEKKRQRWLKMPKQQQKVCVSNNTKTNFPLFAQPFVYVYVFHPSIHQFRQTGGVSATNNKKRKFDPFRKGKLETGFLGPALKTGPRIRIPHSQPSGAKIERTAVIRVIRHRYPTTVGVGIGK